MTKTKQKTIAAPVREDSPPEQTQPAPAADFAAIIARQLREADDFASGLEVLALTFQEPIDDGTLPGDQLQAINRAIRDEGAQRGLSRDATGKQWTEAVKAVRLSRYRTADPPVALQPKNTGSLTKTLTSNPQDQTSEKLLLNVRRMADIQPQQTDWLWFPYLPLGKLTMLEGDPGLGKSWLTCAMAAAVAAGEGLPGMERTSPRNALMFFTEDGAADTVRPRLDSMRADVSRIYAVDEPVCFDATGLLAIEEAIINFQPALVVVDPLFAFLGASIDMHRANETRPVLQSLKAIAERHKIAVILVRHLSKGSSSKAIYRGLGSIDFTAAVRSVLLVGQDPDDPSKRAIVQTKNNLAAFGEPIGYELRPNSPDIPFAWTGTSDLTADRILNSASEGEVHALGRREAEDFLRELLSDGGLSAKEVEQAARDAGISKMTLRRAKDSLGIKPQKLGGHFGGKQAWIWQLSEGVQVFAEDAQKVTSEHLQASSERKSSYTNGLAEDAHLPQSEHLQRKPEHLHLDTEVF